MHSSALPNVTAEKTKWNCTIFLCHMAMPSNSLKMAFRNDEIPVWNISSVFLKHWCRKWQKNVILILPSPVLISFLQTLVSTSVCLRQKLRTEAWLLIILTIYLSFQNLYIPMQIQWNSIHWIKNLKYLLKNQRWMGELGS